ncbi:hypothetical protein FA10DRAFT_267798 [Acaromyces ingoldii]|uniref:Uncharacterized protein n=1 Tax=Acaromyces ingoldii TaxID=215250 RepID=A0A316YJ32_9BASI|nr:hypothetical protein FA10DRAFT_267798 [Acaromyces ingoldii]PWN89219.1 hypothetical protein FA10DRAFT_267798 [Acaromyces ingoldii]
MTFSTALVRSIALTARPAPHAHAARAATVAAPRWTRSLATRADNDPTPGKARSGGSEQTMPDSGASEDEIANSDGAYDSGKPRPEDSANKIEHEKSVDMGSSAASREPSKNATEGKHNEKTSSETGSNPPSSGGTASSRKG